MIIKAKIDNATYVLRNDFSTQGEVDKFMRLLQSSLISAMNNKLGYFIIQATVGDVIISGEVLRKTVFEICEHCEKGE